MNQRISFLQSACPSMIMCHTMVSRIFAFLVWSTCAFGLVFWGLRWLSKPLPVPDYSSAVSMVNAPRSDMTRMLTAPETAASAAPTTDQSALAARIQLIGLMAAPSGQGAGVALLTIDGKPAKAFRVGQMVVEDHVILAITKQGVNIGLPNTDLSTAVTLAAQGLPPAATGTLAAPDNSTDSANSPALSPQPPVGNSMSGAFGRPNGRPAGMSNDVRQQRPRPL